MKTLNFKNITLKASLVSTLCISSVAYVHAESIEGVLEQSGAYSALFTASPESGDLIGYAFKNNSAVSKIILAQCAPSLVCKISQATTRDLSNPAVLTFKEAPSGWLEVTRAANVTMVPGIANYEKSAKTRFGVLSIHSDTNTLVFKGKPVLPGVAGNSGLSIVASHELGKNDVLLLQNTGGSACPALYIFVTVAATGLRATPEFGTCSDFIRVTSDLKNSVTVVMAGSDGQASVAPRPKAAGLPTTVFKYANGQLQSIQAR